MNSCLKSINAQTLRSDIRVLSASSGEHEPNIEVSNVRHIKHTHFHLPDHKHFPEKVKYLEPHIDEDCEYLGLLNDDVILNYKCIENMLLSFRLLGEKPILLEPHSNCEMGKLYVRPQQIEFKGNIKSFDQPQYRLKDISPEDIEHIIWGTYLPDMNIQIVPWIAFYCTLMHKDTYFKLGGIDPIFKTGQDDLDFCKRASEAGIPSAITAAAFTLHYSGITADDALTTEEREFNRNYYNEKHGFKNQGL
jgi:GT2 family glycosyltransferase